MLLKCKYRFMQSKFPKTCLFSLSFLGAKVTFFIAACVSCSLDLKVKQCLYHMNILAIAEQFLPRQEPRFSLQPHIHSEVSTSRVGKRLGDIAGTSCLHLLSRHSIPYNAMLSNKISGKWIGCGDVHDGFRLPKKSLHIFDRRGRDD